MAPLMAQAVVEARSAEMVPESKSWKKPLVAGQVVSIKNRTLAHTV